MPPAPRVSVVLPARNAGATLPAAVASIRAQTLPDWELIVVDDGSTDGSAAFLAGQAAADPRIRVVAQAARGLVPALNTGLAAARAPLIARMDADDLSLPERLAAQVALLEAQPATGLCSCGVRFGGDAAAQQGYALHVAWINSLVEPAEIARNRFIESPVAHPSVMFRRALVDRHGGYRDHAWPEDYELWLRWLDAGVVFAKVPAPLLVWNDPPQRLSRTHPRYSPEAFYDCKCHYLARWIGREIGPDRPVYLWGAGRPTRRRFAALEAAGVRFAGFVDVDAKKIGGSIAGRAVLAPGALPPPGRCFIVGGVATRGARDLIRAELVRRGHVEGRDFLMAA